MHLKCVTTCVFEWMVSDFMTNDITNKSRTVSVWYCMLMKCSNVCTPYSQIHLKLILVANNILSKIHSYFNTIPVLNELMMLYMIYIYFI